MTPDFETLLGDEPDARERARLRRVHDLLGRAGPLPELPPSLAEAPDPEVVRPRPARRPRWTALALPVAAALAAVSFAGGYAVRGGSEVDLETDFVLPMRGTAAAPQASASLRVYEIDEAGNWPMELTVEGLPTGRRYELLLTRDGRPAASCGFFVVHEGRTVAYLNAPYRLRRFDGWIVTRAEGGQPLLRDADA